jgi:hypothetical protein
MIGMVVTSTGLLLVNTELLWIRAHAPENAAQVILGTLLNTAPQPPDHWLAFYKSHCFQWEATSYSCSSSALQLELVNGVEYDIAAWSEADDRREPDRTMSIVAQAWSFHPGDVNLNGVVDCGDLDSFLENQYDWNLDGGVTEDDPHQVSWAISESLADANNDGVIDRLDVVILGASWGPCPAPPDPCPADLNCDGVVDLSDLIRLVNHLGF